MTKKNDNIWIWIQNGILIKAISSPNYGTIKIYDKNDNLILRRTGLNKFQIKQIEISIIKYRAKKLNKLEESFNFI
jgi:hypothetical protein